MKTVRKCKGPRLGINKSGLLYYLPEKLELKPPFQLLLKQENTGIYLKASSRLNNLEEAKRPRKPNKGFLFPVQE